MKVPRSMVAQFEAKSIFSIYEIFVKSNISEELQNEMGFQLRRIFGKSRLEKTLFAVRSSAVIFLEWNKNL